MKLSLLRNLIAAGAVLGALLAPETAFAQDSRGVILGTLTDSGGGLVPGASVTVTNEGTNVSVNLVTDSKGAYQARNLNSGIYSVTAKLDGFKTAVRRGIEVRVGDVIGIDLTLSTGGISEVVVVTAEAPILDTLSPITGTTVDSKQIAELPLGDGTAYMLTRLAPGIMDNSDLHFSRPADNANLGGIVANGVQGGNEFTIDGAPNMSNARGVGFSPPSDTISEFKVQTNAFDAQSGHTAGAVVNLALKSGENRLKGAFSYFNRDASRAETPLLTERAGGTKPTRTYNRFTGMLSGPIFKDRTFFMIGAEHLRDVQPEPASYTVPTAKMRAGDFSEFSNLVYDPLTATSTGTRSPFAGNVIPANRINPVAAAYAAYYPMPNRPGTVANYFTNQLRPYDYNAVIGRIDHNISAEKKLFLTGYFNKRREDRYNWAAGASNATGEGEINGFLVTQGYDYRSNTGATLGYTQQFSSTMLLDVRAAWSRFGEYRDPAQTFDPSKLGFSSTALQLMSGYQYLPFITLGTFSTTNSNSTIASLGSLRSDFSEGFSRPFNSYSLTPSLTKLYGSHTARLGYDGRLQNWKIINDGYVGGRFAFNGAYTRASNSAAQNDRAQSWAQFLLGLPTVSSGAVATPGTTSSQFDVAVEGDYNQWSHAVYLQDDWRVSSKLSVNLGLRFELNPGLTEAENRNLAGFDTTVANPIADAAQANYARNPIAEIAASSFAVRGGVKFADGATYSTLKKPLPRGAFSYLINDRTVIRGGIGLFSYDYFFDNINQQGFSVGTPVLTTNDNGITFTGANLTNPIPSGQLNQPVGSSLGFASSLGQNLGNLVQYDRKSPYYTRWQIGAQRDFGSGWKVEVMYVGSLGRNLPTTRASNNIPIQYLSTSPMRDTARESFLTQNVTSPFTGLLPGSTINGATVQRQQLLRPFPEFGTFNLEANVGSDSYHAGTISAQKRFSNGNSFSVQYTRSTTRDKLNYLNPADGVLEDRVSPNDRPNRLSVGTSLRLPFGKGEKWGSGWKGAKEAILGGWQLSATYQYQTGFPLTWGTSIYYNGDPTKLKSTIGEKCSSGSGISGLDCPGWDTTGFYINDGTTQTNGAADPAKQRADQRIQLGNNVRYFPSTIKNMRAHDLHLMDVGLYKNFSLPRDMKLQVRFEAINALNYTVLWSPQQDPRNANFGLVSTDRNSPRDIQIGARLTF
ncbi:MAG: TonB-dependent receptor [Vicinamibacteria bacterium]|nr:TonB-dependent receptor [Vicinamibacteria bacterium]